MVSFDLASYPQCGLAHRFELLCYDLLSPVSSVEESWRDDAFAELVLGSQWNKEVWNVLPRRCVLVDEGNKWVNH
jgi:hypothetical protein